MTNPSFESNRICPIPPKYPYKPSPYFQTATAKKALLKQLARVNPYTLINALIETALMGFQFPPPLDEQLELLKILYDRHKRSLGNTLGLEDVIADYLATEGYNQFLLLLQQPINPSEWNPEFLSSLAKQLHLSSSEKPLVELAIKQGKIYWRIIQGENVLYDRTEKKQIPFDFEHAQTWYMDWKAFRLFKDSGKRQGTVSITYQRFINEKQFGLKYGNQSIAVRHELKEKGILNKHDRLSTGWGSLSNINLPLDSLTPLSPASVKECLHDLGADKRGIEREKFIAWWREPYQYRAELIWNYLKDENILNFRNQWVRFHFPIRSFLHRLQPTYSEVIEALYNITINADYQEQIEINDYENNYIYRPERDCKSWANSTGKVFNKSPTDKKYRVQPWDVGTYSNLTAHSSQGDGLDLDHIPSTAILKHIANERLSFLDWIKELNEEADDDEIEVINAEYAQLSHEIIEHGPQWWVVAIPRELHIQGASYGKSTSYQAAAREHPFITDIVTYLSILAQRKNEFYLSEQDHLKALGAFRRLYRCLVKEAEIVDGCYATGIAHQAFFKNPAVLKKLDYIFFTETRQLVERQERLEEQALFTAPLYKI